MIDPASDAGGARIVAELMGPQAVGLQDVDLVATASQQSQSLQAVCPPSVPYTVITLSIVVGYWSDVNGICQNLPHKTCRLFHSPTSTSKSGQHYGAKGLERGKEGC